MDKSSLAHFVNLFLALILTTFVAVILADGASVIFLKPEKYLPVVTDPATGLSATAAYLLGPNYGVGLSHDTAGRIWNQGPPGGKTLAQILGDLTWHEVQAALKDVPRMIAQDEMKHPAWFLSCPQLQTAGLAVMSFGYIACGATALLVVLHALALARFVAAGTVKAATLVIWLILVIGYTFVTIQAALIYTVNWTCDQPLIRTVRLYDSFDLNYAIPMAGIAIVVSYLALVLNTLVISDEYEDSAAVGKVSSRSFSELENASSEPEPPPSPPPSPSSEEKAGGKSGLAVPFLITVFVLVSISLGLGLGLGVTQASKDLGPNQNHPSNDPNPCAGMKPSDNEYFDNVQCFKDGVRQALEQAGANVTEGYKGGYDVMEARDGINAEPITTTYKKAGLCPVNVHWHRGAEHYSLGEYDEGGRGPTGEHNEYEENDRRRLAGGDKEVRQGFRCHHHDAKDERFTKEYDWKHCKDMQVGETYEIHWPHSAAGDCGTKWQYQTPFYDGVFCKDDVLTLTNTAKKVGVQAQVFVVINDDSAGYMFDDLIDGMYINEARGFGSDMAIYTGSTTGTSRSNEVCSKYTPITWQVDRKCHVISAKSFDKLCKEMKMQADNMEPDTHAHGARELVDDILAADNQKYTTKPISRRD